MRSHITNKNKFDIHDTDLLQKIDSLGYKVVKLIYQNQRKQRYTLLVDNKGEQMVLKWNSTANPVYSNMIKREIEFLKHNQKFYLPDLIYSESNLLLLKYLDYPTMREWIIDNRNKIAKNKDEVVSSEFTFVVKGIIDYINDFYFTGKKCNCSIDLIEGYKSYFNRLYLSSPMSKKKNKILKYLLLLNKRVYKRR